MALVDRIVAAFEALGGFARYSDLYDYIERNTETPLPKTWKHNVRARIEEHSSDSKAFRGKRDLFYAVQGLGNGIWGLRSALQINQKAIDIDEPSFDKQIREGNQFPERTILETTRVIRDTLMSKQLKTLYHFECQVCGKALHLHNRFYAEAHHLRPLGGEHRGTDEPGNILIVCPNHHVEFDFGSIAIHPLEMTILHIEPSYYLYGKPLSINPLHKINELNIAYHIENVFEGD